MIGFFKFLFFQYFLGILEGVGFTVRCDYSTFFSVEVSQNVKDIKETINRYEELRNKAKTYFKCSICQQT